MTELEQLHEYAAVVGIIDREAALRIHAVIGALESLILRLDRVEPIYGIVPIGTQPERRLNA